MNNFDLKKYLAENKVTRNSRMMNEDKTLKEDSDFSMKVKDLILELQKLYPESKITFECNVDTGRYTAVSDEGEIEIIDNGSTVNIIISGEETEY